MGSRRKLDARWAGPVAAGLAFGGLLVLTLAMVSWVGRSPGWAYDFNAYYDAALRLVATGNPYQAETLSGPFRPGPYGLYLYSPLLAILFVPLTTLGANTAIVVWLALRVGILVLTCLLMPVARPIKLAIFGIAALSAPVLFDLDLGNVSLIVTFLGVLSWRWLDRPMSGVALAVALTIRPTMALIAGWWLVRGVWRPLAWTVVTLAALVLGSLVFVSPARWLDYLTVLRNVSDVTGVTRNVDLGSAVLMLGGPAWAAPVALFAGYLLAAAAILFSLRRDRELSFVVTLMATVLMAPLLWDHYLTLLIVPAAFLAARGRVWGLGLPLLCWLPTITVALLPSARGSADAILPFVALLGLWLPFLAPARGQPPGLAVDGIRRWWARRRPARA